MGKNKLFIRGGFQETESKNLFVTAPLKFLDTKVRFSLRFCDTQKYCIRKLNESELTRLYNTLKHFEDMTWQQVRQTQREKGFSIEPKDSSNHKRLEQATKGTNLNTFLHFRVDGSSVNMRVFGAILDDMCCILQFDRTGEVNH